MNIVSSENLTVANTNAVNSFASERSAIQMPRQRADEKLPVVNAKAASRFSSEWFAVANAAAMSSFSSENLTVAKSQQ